MDRTSNSNNMKHSKKSKDLQEPHHKKFSCLLACFGGGKKLAFDHPKKSHHHHRWLLSPYWSKVRLRGSPSSSKTVPYDFISVSPPSSTKSKSWSGGEAVVKAAESKNIGVEEKPDQKASLVFKEKSRSTIQNKTPTCFEEGDLSQKSRNSESRKSNKTPTSKLPDSFRPSKVDPSIGLSIVILTLLIMIIWGRVCAILCTSAWLYFVPRFHLKEGKSKSKCENKSLDLKLRDEGQNLRMKDYKKRIILEGFLDRENRQIFG